MPNVGMRALVPPIAGDPSPHGLLGGCVEVVTTNDVHELNGTDTLPASCAQAHPWQSCPDPGSGEFPWTNPVSKIFDRLDTCTFEPLTAYAGAECSTVGMTFPEMVEQAAEQLRRGEQRALEEWFMSRWLANATHTVDVTPLAGAVHIVNGVGLLETWLATEYGGAGLIHAPIGTATLLSQNRVVGFGTEETCPETLAGNKVILGAGYTANLGPSTPPTLPVPAAAGEAWLYITPPMRIRRDTPQVVQSNDGQSINTLVNDRRLLAETTFVPEVACCKAAAVRVTLSACC
jgi:hypothetical protein